MSIYQYFKKRIPGSYLKKKVNALPITWPEVQKLNGKVLFSLLLDNMCYYFSEVSGDKIKTSDQGFLIWFWEVVMVVLNCFVSNVDLCPPCLQEILASCELGSLWLIHIWNFSSQWDFLNNCHAEAFWKHKIRRQNFTL